MNAAEIFEGIALLIELAQRGEIDPWDVRVIEAIDRYLNALLAAQEITPGSYESNLSQSGQAFLLASLLVLFKANTLTGLDSPLDESELETEELLLVGEGEFGTRLRLPLEQQLRRRPVAVPPQKRPVTLQDLIEHLQLIATQLQSEGNLADKTSRSRHRSVSQSRADARKPLELAHQENLTQVARELEEFLSRYSSQFFTLEQNWLNLEQLVDLWTQTKQVATSIAATMSHGELPSDRDRLSSQRHEKVSVFWALLLLSAQSKVELSQEEFYQDIKIRTLSDPGQLAIGDTDSKTTVCSV
ncbi:segregation/condensation protein A [Chroococcidiopsis thermalis]|uniref:Segregation and condensation protein A n=1 Tax=Chroococcidiopsis thermalis (strain PCC 7203) TaxID=251229 RepID=K9U1F0_CHRTP|nr:ScpA family protein [Chroococcidiopsis thermalis]AFY88448.1 condensin subunit ScpA [Chroococcidiopsis thermalis PCC 7203]PSB49064.1 segregation/condensation protein A [Cyanosarcina cf. burmensis CCALA 770]